MLASVRHGRPGTAMAAWGERLSAAEIEALVDHIRAKFMPQGASAASGDDPADPTRPLPAGLVGEATRGRALYLANCVACHGAEGDGQGPRAYFIVPGPRNFRDPGARRIYDRPRLYRAIARGKLGSEMPAWDTVLTAQEIADLAEFVFRAYLHGPAGARR
jgi:mono/diheme cytochrome c family protein